MNCNSYHLQKGCQDCLIQHGCKCEKHDTKTVLKCESNSDVKDKAKVNVSVKDKCGFECHKENGQDICDCRNNNIL